MLHRCFNMMEDDNARVHFKKYLCKIKAKLAELSSTPLVKLLVDMGDPQAFALRSAASKFNPLFWPLQGRMCLPLPTPSMLEDLQACLDINKQIITEVFPTITHQIFMADASLYQVGWWIDGLGEHAFTLKNNTSNVHSWSKMVGLKLHRFCTNMTTAKAEELLVWVSNFL